MKETKLCREGYWKTTNPDSMLPMPIEQEERWRGKKRFLIALEKIETAHAEKRFMKGFSNCRICGCANGSADNTYKGWQWPSGLRHYIEAHNVRPSLAFQEMILNETLE